MFNMLLMRSQRTFTSVVEIILWNVTRWNQSFNETADIEKATGQISILAIFNFMLCKFLDSTIQQFILFVQLAYKIFLPQTKLNHKAKIRNGSSLKIITR